MKILANDGIAKEGVDALHDQGFEVYTQKVPQEELENYINEHHIEILLVRSATQVRQELIDACPGLKLIGRGGVGMDNIDVEYAKEQGLYVINTPAASSRSVAELVLAHMFGLARYLHDSNRNMPLEGESNFKALKKSYAKSTELKGKTLAVVGLGRIGLEVAKLGLGVGMNVIGVDSSDTDGIKTVPFEFFNGQKIEFKIKVHSLQDILPKADYVSIHIPAQGKYIIDQPELDLMKPSAILVNAARGGVINEVALVDALNKDKLAFAALDVFENEPQPEVQLLMHPQISLSPHVGGTTVEAQGRIGLELAEQITEVFKS